MSTQGSIRPVAEISADIHAAAGKGDSTRLQQLAAEAAGGNDASYTCIMHIARGLAASNISDHAVALEEYHAALAISEPSEQSVRTASILNNMGNVVRSMGNIDEAMSLYSRSLALSQEAGNDEFIAMALGNLGVASAMAGDFALAHEYMARSLAIEEGRGDKTSAATTLGNMGVVAYNVGDYAGSIELYQRAYDVHEEMGNVRGMAIVLGNIGSSYVAVLDHARALEYFHRALPLHEQVQNRASIARVNGNIGVALRHLEDHDEAIQHLVISSDLSEQLGHPHEFMFSTCNLADTYVTCGRLDDARATLKRVAHLKGTDRQVLAHFFHVEARVLEAEGALNDAMLHFQLALEAAEASGGKLMQADLHKEMRDLARKSGDFDGYVQHNDAFMALSEEVRGQEVNRKLALLEAKKRIDAERVEKERHRSLLYSTLPPSIADRVMRSEAVNDAYDCAAVMFMDMVGFTTMSSSMQPDEVVRLLSEIFTMCDAIVAEHGLMKIKTIGDSYMSVAFDGNVAVQAASAALAMMSGMRERFPDLNVRIGIHCGPVTAGVIGTERLQYDVWGD
ncbi:MAG: tetratricopeptide repeat protein, partial [Bacteroidetes bacterium]|nr:tetratricopeptide repeat protein [Bacteroidota bacterium]